MKRIHFPTTFILYYGSGGKKGISTKLELWECMSTTVTVLQKIGKALEKG